MRRGRRGSSILEAALFLPFILLLLMGMVQLGKLTYVYFTLKKALYGAATYLASQQGVNFCDSEDPLITAAKTYALTGTTDSASISNIPSLTTDMIQVSTECIDPATRAAGPCTSFGCDTAAGGPRPDFIIVGIPNGYQLQLLIPYTHLDPLLLKPEVRLPFGGS